MTIQTIAIPLNSQENKEQRKVSSYEDLNQEEENEKWYWPLKVLHRASHGVHIVILFS